MPQSGPFVASEFSACDFDALRAVLQDLDRFDLTRYNEACIKRRIATRIRELGYADPRPYIARLRDDAEERRTLLAALSLHVSRFYRDVTTFTVLRARFLPELVTAVRQRREPELRCWSAGCAGGEEAYSLALLTADLPAGTCSILGEDISDEVLARARTGHFDAWHVSDVAAAERERYFAPAGRGYQIAEALRARVRFARRDLLADAPYPAADLILCRYVLIYFSAADQARVIRRLAAALAPGGLLVLGRTEVLRDSGGDFESVDEQEKIFRKRT